jgi:hypothetical protein
MAASAWSATKFQASDGKVCWEMKVTKIPLFLVADLINTKPKNSFVKSFKISAQESERMDADASVDLRYYVQQ